MITRSRSDYRKLIRAQRHALSVSQQNHASQQLLQQCLSLDLFKQAQHIALYLPSDGEIDTHALITALWQQQKQVYLPVLHPLSPGHLLFLHYLPSTPMVTNKYGISEPKLDQRLIKPSSQLDLIVTPLVAFDQNGQRLGMGGGYYDRTLEAWFQTGKGAQPLGIAHDCQQVDLLPSEHWDIPLPTIITPSHVWQWSRQNK
ncbi:5-formyltetrahydrofolate cyclo-ligase [Vibrio sp. 10N.286.49.B3]|uniref:5-formyltetrahydrofolate cyclo-ligase n=1 Tax=Vibrio sp. 10N.286.49.B3 TaxID=1880855 RepID=UPI000C857FFC|nr:5-formyltetrahydrofolate cyclo-ligase [Vibrio sp. 10N.286.49.B3]PMH43878.1 5-formyltetrahydrofolate cyclo-ligase [Vibrio sp. 10N.286.49.B3]